MRSVLLFIICFSLSFNILFAQTPNWLWAKCSGAGVENQGNSLAVDKNGNSYVAGHFYGPSLTFGNTILSNAGNEDVFIVKYDSSGTLLWARSGGGSGEELVYGIAVDKNDNAYITGSFKSVNCTFGSITMNNDTTDGSTDVFVVKYDPNGTVLWAKSAGGCSYDVANGIAVDTSGNAYITGGFSSRCFSFGTDSLINTDSTGNAPDIFIAKYASNGNLLWTKSAGGSRGDIGYGIAVDILGNAYVSGGFSSPHFNYGSSTLINYNGNGYGDVFIFKCNANGNPIWAKTGTGNFNESAISLAIDKHGNSYVTGMFESSGISFSGNTLSGNPCNSPIMYVVKHDSSGNVVWLKGTSASGVCLVAGPSSIAVDGAGNPIVTGDFTSNNIIFGSNVVYNFGSSNLFVVKYDTAGTVLWVKQTSGSGSDGGMGIGIDGSENIYLCGSYISSVAFGSAVLNNSSSYPKMFIAKLGTSTLDVHENINDGSSISIYPNPFNDQTIVSFSIEQKNSSIKLMDILGKEVKTINFSGKNLLIEREGLKEGIYFINIKTQNGFVTKKLIIN